MSIRHVTNEVDRDWFDNILSLDGDNKSSENLENHFLYNTWKHNVMFNIKHKSIKGQYNSWLWDHEAF